MLSHHGHCISFGIIGLNSTDKSKSTTRLGFIFFPSKYFIESECEIVGGDCDVSDGEVLLSVLSSSPQRVLVRSPQLV